MSELMLTEDSQKPYPICFELLPHLETELRKGRLLSEILDCHPERCGHYPFLADLARIEEARYRLMTSPPPIPDSVTYRMVNPALELIPVKWINLPEFLSDRFVIPKSGEDYVLVLVRPGTKHADVRKAGAGDLLALKLVVEDIDSRKAALQGRVSVGAIDELLYRAVHRGLVIVPPSRIRRPEDFPRGDINDPEFFSSPTFTLQWHITQVCDLNCRHCYDRSDRREMTLNQAIGILDDLYDFCRAHHVFGQVSFSGGNPLLYPFFDRLYREAADRGFMTAVLGNPMPRGRIEKMLSVQKPEFYQVSLEGLKIHNDYIRGSGHFDRTIDFLKLLGELNIYRMVMLTLTRDNMDQVIELANQLRGLTDLFTFNRLATVGRGAELSAAPPDKFSEFLARYLDAAETNPCMGLKDNLFNLLQWQRGSCSLDGGCAGHGCGAAFNFVALLPDGEVHACRKLPSLIGNIHQNRLNDIYHGSLAAQYRAGSAACKDCPIRPVCGACLAVGYGFGLDIFNEPDPYCFRNQTT
ncbi:MAG: thio(seleno)oxazole modification radical SAM maturase SbtM [Desulfobacterales bacterium]|nr:thio(seleno)oxazole modification radical SAM maturase SbtM [Desulfobacterales bacterium]